MSVCRQAIMFKSMTARAGRGLVLMLLYAYCRTGNGFVLTPLSKSDSSRHSRFSNGVMRNDRVSMFHHGRHLRTRLRGSIRENRDKIERARSRLRDALRAGDEELAVRLKAFILHLRAQDPQYATQDAMNDALSKGLFGAAAKLKIQLDEINQNPFRQGLLRGRENDQTGETAQQEQEERQGGGESSMRNSDDISEDMSWGFDQSFFQTGDGDDEDHYDEI